MTPDLMPLVLDYMRPWFFGLVFLVLPIVGTAVIRGHGSTSIQAYVMLTAALSNAVLDPILIFGFGPISGWGIAGAAWASVIAHAITMLVMLWFLLRPVPLIDTARVSLRDWIETGKTLLGLGLPATLVNALGPLATMIVLRLLSEIGHDAVAGFALGTRIEALALIPATALSMAIGPVISQNMAAGRLDRVAAAWRLVLQFTAVIGALAGLLFVAAPTVLTAPFAVSSDVAQFAEMYLIYIAFSLVASALIPVFSSMQSAMGTPRPGLMTSLLRYAFFFVPGAWIGLSLGGATGLLAGLAVAHILAGFLALAWGTATFAAPAHPLKPTKLKGAIQ